MKKAAIIKKILMFIGIISLVFFIAFLILVLVIANSMSSKKVKNPDIKSLVNDIKQMDAVQKIEARQRGPGIYIDIHADEAFTIEDSYQILDVAKKHITIETKNELMKEFKCSQPLDIEIYVKNGTNQLKYFRGTCYASYSKSEPPDYEKYVWD